MRLLNRDTTNFVLSVLTIALAIRWVLYGLTVDDFLAFLFIMELFLLKWIEEGFE